MPPIHPLPLHATGLPTTAAGLTSAGTQPSGVGGGPPAPLASAMPGAASAPTLGLDHWNPTEYRLCRTLRQLQAHPDQARVDALRASASVESALTLTLATTEAAFVERRHPGFGRELSEWLRNGHTCLQSARLHMAVKELEVLLSVRCGTSSRPKEPRERLADAVLTRWAGQPQVSAAFRQALVWRWMGMHHAPEVTLRLPGEYESPEWERLDRAHVLSCITGLVNPPVGQSTRTSEGLNFRLTMVVDAALRHDEVAFHFEALGHPSGAADRSPLQALKHLESVLAAVGRLPSCAPQQREAWFSLSLELLPLTSPDAQPEADRLLARRWVDACVAVAGAGQPTDTASPCPAAGAGPGATVPPLVPAADAWTRWFDVSEVVSVTAVLAAASELPLTPVAQARVEAASRMLARSVSAFDYTAVLESEDMTLLVSALSQLMRTAFDRISEAPNVAGTGLRPRGPEEMQALRDLTAWARRASGAEAVRRERWVEVMLDRTFHPTAHPAVWASLLRRGDELPPWPAVRTLAGGQRLPGMAVLGYRGEVLTGGQAMSRLLEGLAVRHVDLPVSELARAPGGAELALDCLTAATLQLRGSPRRDVIAQALTAVAESMRSVFLVRFRQGNQPLTVDISWLPAQWDANPDRPGEYRHHPRDTLREHLMSLASVWPQGHMPPRVRSNALNPLEGGDDVLGYMVRLRRQRASTPGLEAADLDMAVRLESVTHGMATDLDYARRCRALVAASPEPNADPDGGMRTLDAMMMMWETEDGGALSDVVANAFVHACLARAILSPAYALPGSAHGRQESLHSALETTLVLRWFVAAALRNRLGDVRIRLGEQPLFGRLAERVDWHAPDRRAALHAKALAVIGEEVRQGCPGLLSLTRGDGPLARAYRERLPAEQGGADDERFLRSQIDALMARMSRREPLATPHLAMLLEDTSGSNEPPLKQARRGAGRRHVTEGPGASGAPTPR